MRATGTAAFRILRNNGLAPAWIEADKEIRAERAALAELAERTARFIDTHRHDAKVVSAVTPPPSKTLSARLRRFWSGSRPEPRPADHFTLDNLRYERERVRREYLRRSEELNQKITEHNSSLPFDLLWRERQKISPEQAADAFDRAGPPLHAE